MNPRATAAPRVKAITPREYLVEPLDTGIFSGTLKAAKLQAALNARGREGWRFVRSVHEKRRVAGLFQREAHFLIFEREG